ncbi:MAG: hypothetical protein HPY74_09030 [Firmicutes bacterium]|nr:hypothetical protein [Bacillota bacterium]
MAIGFPQEDNIRAVEFPHFPTRQQAVIWRNWGMVPVERLAQVLKTDERNILNLAEDMGLVIPPSINKYWLERGYITIIRANWHLLTYKQILTLLAWSDEKLKYTLKEDDFLYIKLGSFKPDLDEVTYRPLSIEEKERTKEIREILAKHFPQKQFTDMEAFDFLNRFILDKDFDKGTDLNLQKDNTRVNTFISRFQKIMGNNWRIRLARASENGNNNNENNNDEKNNEIVLDIKTDPNLKSESHTIEINHNKVYITAVDEVGLLRGLQWVAKEVDANGCLSIKKGIIKRKTRFDLRYIYSYFAVYGDPLLDPEINPYPDGLLSCLSELGINGIWLQGVLYSLVPWKKAPELSTGWEKRIEGLRNIVKRAGDYGIGVYLYLNEPRAMPEEFFKEHPEWKGSTFHGLTSLCTSHEDIQDYLRTGTARLFSEVPDLAGVFTITMSENHTNCYSHTFAGNKPDCPICSKRSQAEVIAEVNNLIAEGAHSIKPDARVIAWTWGWHPQWSDEAISLLNDNVMVMCTSEEAMPTNISGVKGEVIDYTMSIPGPGERAVRNWRKAAALGHKTVAKVQFNNTWECSAVPYLPVMDLVEKHINNLSNSGVNGLMLSWTLGGYPSLNLEFASQLYWEEEIIYLDPPASTGAPVTNDGSSIDTEHTEYQENARLQFAIQKFGEKAAPYIVKVWSTFSNAFREFPFNIGVVYTAPQNYGPMNLLFEKPTGYRATMIGYPYDDLERWRSIYPEDIFEEQFRKLSEKWKDGLEFISKAKSSINKNDNDSNNDNDSDNNNDSDDDSSNANGINSAYAIRLNYINELESVSSAAYCHFRSTYLQIKFVRLRNKLLQAEGLDGANQAGEAVNIPLTGIIDEIISVIDEEIELAKMLYGIVKRDSRIGYEASNHYYYTPRDLQEKVINCEYLRKKYLNYYAKNN